MAKDDMQQPQHPCSRCRTSSTYSQNDITWSRDEVIFEDIDHHHRSDQNRYDADEMAATHLDLEPTIIAKRLCLS